MKLLFWLTALVSSNIAYATYCHHPHTPKPQPVNCSNAEKVINGEFEDDTVTNASQWQLFSEIQGWEAEWTQSGACNTHGKKNAFVELQAFLADNLPESTQYVELDTDCPNGGQRTTNIKLYQYIEAEVGEMVKFKFNYKPRRLSGNMKLKAKIGKYTYYLQNFSDLNWKTFEQTVKIRHKDVKHGKVKISFKDLGDQDTFGMFVDNVSAKATNCQPSPVACTFANQVVSYNPVGSFAANRKDPNQSLGAPNGEPYAEPNVRFTSLGFGGSIVLKLDNPVNNVVGPDLRIYEVTGGNETYAQYKEEADVYGSMDNENWTFLGRVKNDNNAPSLGEVELGSMDKALYIKIVDQSPLVNGRDGFDVDSVGCINQSNSWDSRVFYLDKNAQKIFKARVIGNDVELKQFVSMPYSSAHLGFEDNNLFVVESAGDNRISQLNILTNTWSANQKLDIGGSLTQVSGLEDILLVNKTSSDELIEYNRISEQLLSLGKVYENGKIVKLIGGDIAHHSNGNVYLVTQHNGGRLYQLNFTSCNCSTNNAILIKSNLGKVSGLAELPSGDLLISILNSKKMKVLKLSNKSVREVNLRGDLHRQGSGADLAN